MTADEIRARLAALREMDFAGADRLARDIASEARAPLRALQRSVTWIDNPDRAKAEALLRAADDLAIPQWLVSARRLQGAERMAAVAEAARAHERLQRRIVHILRAMLAGRSPIPPPDALGDVERPAPVVRECDEAWLLLQRVLDPDEEDADYRERAATFVGLGEAERDRLIERALAGAPDGLGPASPAERPDD